MCLFVEDIRPKFAEKELTFYKVLMVTDHGYSTPYRLNFVLLDKTIIPDGTIKPVYTGENYAISEGVIHLYRNSGTALQEANYMNAFRAHKCIVVKAIVPKGAMYYEGVNLSFKDCIGATSVRYEKACYFEDFAF